MYSFLVGAAQAILKPSAYWEFTVVHLVNVVALLVSLCGFEFFSREFVRAHELTRSDSRFCRLPGWAWQILGYSLCLWSGLSMIGVGRVCPDLLVATAVYMAAGLILRIHRGSGSWSTFGLLGLVLGLGYYAKAPLFPLAFVFLAISLFAVGNLRKAVPRAALALLVFLLLASPLLVVLSRQKGRFTFGESGRFNYLVLTTRYGKVVHKGKPIHPMPVLLDVPRIYGFGSALDGTYPAWLDPTYWSDGIVTKFSLSAQTDLLQNNLKSYYNMLLSGQTALLFGFLLLILLGPRGATWKNITAEWPVLASALAGLGMYLPVYVEPRMVGSFVLLLWMGLFAAVRLSASLEVERIARVVVLVVAMVLALAYAGAGLGDLYQVFRPKPHRQWQVANELKQMGLIPEGKVATIGDSPEFHWARLGRWKIVAMIQSEDANAYWQASPALRARAEKAFSETGAVAVITDSVSAEQARGWQSVGQTGFFVHLLNQTR